MDVFLSMPSYNDNVGSEVLRRDLSMNKKIVLFIVSIIILCLLALILYNNNVNFSAKKINFNFVNKNIKNFVANNKGKNGIYLYENGEKVFYLYLNDYNVEQGTEALYFTDVKIE